MTVEGVWNVYIDTPLGRQHAIVELFSVDGALVGTATDVRSQEKVPLNGLTTRGDRVTWQQSITRPMRLNLAFEVVITGDSLSGTAKPGRLPASTVTGRRVVD